MVNVIGLILLVGAVAFGLDGDISQGTAWALGILGFLLMVSSPAE